MRVLIVGAGLSGLTAGALLTRAGHSVLMFDTREVIGGNCAETEFKGVTVHKYGPHVFHTNDEDVWRFVGRYTKFVPYTHRVLARTMRHLSLLPIPYNTKTASILGKDLTDNGIRKLFFEEYSEKMWGLPFSKLPAFIRDRVPQRRDNDDDRYFTDKHQGLPASGYNNMLVNMATEIGLDNMHMGVRKDTWKKFQQRSDLIIYTGCIDEYYDFQFGHLPYRTLKFEMWEEKEKQVAAVINECNKIKHYTRTTDYSILNVKPCDKSIRAVEIPAEYIPNDKETPFYPMCWGQAEKIAAQYSRLKPKAKTVFAGRLGTYKYLDMDKAIADTMRRIREIVKC